MFLRLGCLGYSLIFQNPMTAMFSTEFIIIDVGGNIIDVRGSQGNSHEVESRIIIWHVIWK